MKADSHEIRSILCNPVFVESRNQRNDFLMCDTCLILFVDL